MLEQLVKLLDEKQNIFITGGAGVGKTTLTASLIKYYESQHKKVAKLGSTGSAAALFGGQTLHSFFDFSVASSIEELKLKRKFNLTKKLKKVLSSLDLIIIDEISMISADVLDMIRLRLLQSEYENPVVVVGDFLQLPPISKGTKRVQFAFESISWELFDFHIIELKSVHRTSEEEFIRLLNNVRFARISQEDEEFLNSLVKPFNKELKDYTLLFGKNLSAKEHNRRQLGFIDHPGYIYEATVIKHDKKVTQESCEKFMQDARIDKELELKEGVRVLFTKNSWNYFNGQRGVVTSLNEEYIVILKDDGVHVKLEPLKTDKSIWVEDKTSHELIEHVEFSIYQFPITLAFGITIHKSQGMSISDLIIETNEIFAPSQFYVALSRSTSSHRTILIEPKRAWKSIIYNHKIAADFVQSLQ